MSSPQWIGRRSRVVVLGAVVALTGCFSEELPGGGIDDDDGVGTSTTVAPSLSSDTGEPLPGTTGVADSSSGDVEPSTGEPEDESTGGSSDGGSEDSGTSTGELEDTSTGEAALSVEVLAPGDLVVTEVMYNPHCDQDNCEWIEILNATDSTVNLLDLYIQDSDYSVGNQGRVTIDLVVGPGEVAVVARGVNIWPYDFDPDAVYGPNPGFNNGSPERVVLRNSTEILDETAIFYGGEQGVAWSLSGSYLDAEHNDSANYWCDAVIPLPADVTVEQGSPGVINPPC